MAILASVGSSHESDSFTAGATASRIAMEGQKDTSPSFGFVFSSVAFDQQEMLRGVQSSAAGVTFIGCSTAGEITTAGSLPDSSVVVMVISSDSTLSFTPGIGMGIKHGEFTAGVSLADSILARAGGSPLRGCIMLPDGLAGNGAEIVRGMLSVLGKHFPLVGGSAGDDYRFKETYQYWNGEVHTGDAVGVGLSGTFAFGVGVKHGWGVLGLPAKVTRSESNVIHEIDGKPAMALYEKYFGDKAKDLRNETLAQLAVSYPLGLKVEGSEEYLIRDPLSVDEHGSITCAAEVPQGADVRIMMGTRKTAIDMARHAAEQALAALEGKTPKAIFIFNCIARKKLLGEDRGLEITAIQGVLGKDVPLIGLYTYGEQAPLDGVVQNMERCNSVFHNETVVIYVIGE